MPITKSAMKRMRSNERKRQRNQRVLARLKTISKRFKQAFDDQDASRAKVEAQAVKKYYDKAASKGVIPKGRADRKKARVDLALGKLLAAQANE